MLQHLRCRAPSSHGSRKVCKALSIVKCEATYLCLLVLRLTWLHAQTSRDCWKEEHILLRSESERIASSFQHAATEWRGLEPSPDLDNRTQRGILAYGQRKGSMFDELAMEANVYLAVIGKHWSQALERLGTGDSTDRSDDTVADPIMLEDTDEFY